VPKLRVRVNALDLALYRHVRRVARTQDTIRRVRRYSRLGEHGAVRLVAGAAGVALDGRRRGRWARPTTTVGAAYCISTSAAAAMGVSRLCLGQHHPSDVAAGAALGAVLGSLGR
jgi:undecaprenyl-diphosphatase